MDGMVTMTWIACMLEEGHTQCKLVEQELVRQCKQAIINRGKWNVSHACVEHQALSQAALH